MCGPLFSWAFVILQAPPPPVFFLQEMPWPLTPMWPVAETFSIQLSLLLLMSLAHLSLLIQSTGLSAQINPVLKNLQDTTSRCKPLGVRWRLLLHVLLEIFASWGSGRNCVLVTNSRQQKVFITLLRLIVLPWKNVCYFWKYIWKVVGNIRLLLIFKRVSWACV